MKPQLRSVCNCRIGPLLMCALVVCCVPPVHAQSEDSRTFSIHIEGGAGLGGIVHRYRGPSADNERVETSGGRLSVMLAAGGRWMGYVGYTHSNRPLDDRSQGGDFDFYALDAIGYRAYAAGVAYQHRLDNNAWPTDLFFIGMGPRLAGIRNNLEHRVPEEAQAADLGLGLGLDARLRFYRWARRRRALFFGVQAGVDFIPLRPADFVLRSGGAVEVLFGMAFRPW